MFVRDQYSTATVVYCQAQALMAARAWLTHASRVVFLRGAHHTHIGAEPCAVVETPGPIIEELSSDNESGEDGHGEGEQGWKLI